MLEVKRIHVVQGDFSLREVTFCVDPNEYVALTGPSGCGKTTLLEAICGLSALLSGDICLSGKSIRRLPAALRGIGFVPQDGVLFQAMTVAENLAFGLQCRQIGRKQVARRVAEVAEALGIEALLQRDPLQLSGGEARRVAIGRAFAFQPTLLLLDEPLSGLDDATKREVESALVAAVECSEACVLHVTHDLAEVDRLADRVLQIKDGTVIPSTQLGQTHPTTSVPESARQQPSQPESC